MSQLLFQHGLFDRASGQLPIDEKTFVTDMKPVGMHC